MRRSGDRCLGSKKTNLTLGVSKATVELEDLWPLLGQHQPCIQHTWTTRTEHIWDKKTGWVSIIWDQKLIANIRTQNTGELFWTGLSEPAACSFQTTHKKSMLRLANSISSDSTNVLNYEYQLLPSNRQFRVPSFRYNRLKNYLYMSLSCC